MEALLFLLHDADKSAIMLSPLRSRVYALLHVENMEGYRSGHNGAVLKTVRAQVHAGSNPAPSATICPKTRFECEFSDIFLFFFFF